jgi:hypothetical protein
MTLAAWLQVARDKRTARQRLVLVLNLNMYLVCVRLLRERNNPHLQKQAPEFLARLFFVLVFPHKISYC